MLIVQGVPRLGGKQWWDVGWGLGKTSYFVAKCVNISKTVLNTSKIRPTIILWLTESCICALDWHQDRWLWMILNSISLNFQRISRDFADFRRNNEWR